MVISFLPLRLALGSTLLCPGHALGSDWLGGPRAVRQRGVRKSLTLWTADA